MNGSNRTLLDKAKELPSSPGVYLWLDERGRILYVGKAKNLHARVLSYFREDGDGRPQVPWLMNSAVDIDYIVTDTEIEALVTEANLARAKKPKFNVRLKDDKRFPYIKITKESLPRIYLTRKIVDDGSKYLGPYTDVAAVRRTLELAHVIFPLRICEKNLDGNRIRHACLNYQIRKCSGPCAGLITVEEYNRYVDAATQFIQGHNREVVRTLRERMKQASDDLNFELAAELRDRINAVEKVSERRRAFTTERLTGDWDVINYHVIDNEACFVIMEIRDGNILGKKDYLVSGVNYAHAPGMLSSFLTQYYLQSSLLPPEIHLPVRPSDEDAVAALLSGRRGSGVQFVFPQRGEKARLLKLAATNAEFLLQQALEKRDQEFRSAPRTVLSLQHDLRLAKPPRSIACIDISHLHGTDTVGSLVYFRDGRPVKQEYRRFNIETVQGIDDFKSMREVVSRYCRRRIEEQHEMPDLLLVDGGKGQLSSARSALIDCGLEHQPVAGLAKRLEEVFLPGASEPQNIPKTSSSLHLLQRIRDEAHRFAITFQRQRRKKRTITTELTAITGIGPVMAQSLLRKFGSVAAVRRASVDEIAAVEGIGIKRAELIHEYLSRTVPV